MNSAEFNIHVLPLKDKIYRLARSMLCHRIDAEDATQDLLEKLWRRRDMLESYDNLEAFIYISTRNHCLDCLRRSKHKRERSTPLEVHHAPIVDHSSIHEIQDVQSLMRGIIATLPEKQQIIIHLRDIEGHDFEYISLLLGIEKTAIRMALSRARKRVKEEMIKLMNYGTQN